MKLFTRIACSIALLSSFSATGQKRDVGVSPWGPQDELGRLNLMTNQSKLDVLQRIKSGKSFDLSVEYFIGMPSWQAAGDPHYRMWMTHTPRGNQITDPLKLGAEMNQHVSYSGSAFSMYAHMGTHIDALNHFGLNGKIYNGFSADKMLGDRGWTKAGAETIPAIIARGVMLDIAKLKKLKQLSDGYRITREDIIEAAKAHKISLAEGDVVLIRTGRMQNFSDAKAYMKDSPGLGLSATKYLAEQGAMIIGADNLSLEAFPSELESDYVPVHTYLLAQKGIPIIELVNLESLSQNGVYEFAFIAASLKLKGADAAPIRPIAIALSQGKNSD